MQVYLDALGCRLNEAELQTWSQQFKKAGFALTRELKQAQAIVLNTCAVTGEAARKSRQQIRRLHRENPNAKLFVTGCYASLEQQQAEEILGVDRVIANSEKDNLVNVVVEEFALPTMPHHASEPGESALFARNRDRAFIKIQDGCRYRCTYCIVTVARGEEKSREPEELIKEINQLHQQGVSEIVLTGVHVGGYGSDINHSLKALVEDILEHTQMPRIRFASVEPWDLPDDFFELFKNPRVMPHMHLPLQSGVDSVLRRMSRRCKTAEFAELINKARQAHPKFNVTTDIIVGFPGETEEEWAASKDFLGTIDFGHVHIFSFSPRTGTKAATLPNPIPREIKKQRSQELHELAHAKKLKLMREMQSELVSVLWESDYDNVENKRRYWGHTENFHKVAVEIDADIELSGSITSCRITGVHEAGAYLIAELHGEQKRTEHRRIPLNQIN